ncbi:MAG: hypothetical protein HQ506_07725 [Candidatus Marinimicrobia bacterium]|nr:hypothetical protein [Candidatus Neomarinimicrobiota bacterium]
MMKWKQLFKVTVALLVVSLVFITCEEFEEEDYNLSAIDAAAVSAMADTNEVGLSLKSAAFFADGTTLGILLSGGGIDTVIMGVDTSVAIQHIDIYSALVTASTEPLVVNDTVYATILSADSLSFRLLSVPSAGTYVFYLNHHAAPSVFHEVSGAMELAGVPSEVMTPELVASLYNPDNLNPTIKGRYEFELAAGTYLFEMARMESTTSSNIRVVLMREQ